MKYIEMGLGIPVWLSVLRSEVGNPPFYLKKIKIQTGSVLYD